MMVQSWSCMQETVLSIVLLHVTQRHEHWWQILLLLYWQTNMLGDFTFISGTNECSSSRFQQNRIPPQWMTADFRVQPPASGHRVTVSAGEWLQSATALKLPNTFVGSLLSTVEALARLVDSQFILGLLYLDFNHCMVLSDCTLSYFCFVLKGHMLRWQGFFFTPLCQNITSPATRLKAFNTFWLQCFV